MSKKQKTIRAGRIWSNNMYALKTLFGPTPVYGIAIIIEAIRHNLINFLEQTICVYMILDAIENHKKYTTVLWVIALFLALDFVAASVSSLYEQKIKLKYLPIAQQALKNKLYEKAKEVGLARRLPRPLDRRAVHRTGTVEDDRKIHRRTALRRDLVRRERHLHIRRAGLVGLAHAVVGLHAAGHARDSRERSHEHCRGHQPTAPVSDSQTIHLRFLSLRRAAPLPPDGRY